MNSRDKILAAIRKNLPQAAPLPQITTTCRFADPIAQFTLVVQAIGGTVKQINGREDAVLFLVEQSVGGRIVVNDVPAFGEVNSGLYAKAIASAIESVHTVVLRGSMGVAENGAIWLPESAMINRLLPFLCQQLVLVLTEKEIVHTMHDGYADIRAGEEGYGVFIAGPSKTADIEQSLVLGAHGPLNLQVLLVKDGLL